MSKTDGFGGARPADARRLLEHARDHQRIPSLSGDVDTVR